MISNVQEFRENLYAGQFGLRAGITLSDPIVVEALCGSVDFLYIDLENNPTNLESLQAHFFAVSS